MANKISESNISSMVDDVQVLGKMFSRASNLHVMSLKKLDLVTLI